MTTTTEAPTLSRKQKQVYDGLAAGKDPGAIAKQMKITRSGVYGHIRQIRRLGVTLPNESPDANANGQQPVSSITGRDPVVASIEEHIKKVGTELTAIEHDIEQGKRRLAELGVRKQDAQARIDGYSRAREALVAPNGQIH